MEKFGSGINIPDPQHCFPVLDTVDEKPTNLTDVKMT
jgi:hypothetical protein